MGAVAIRGHTVDVCCRLRHVEDEMWLSKDLSILHTHERQCLGKATV